MDSRQSKNKATAPCLILGLGHTGCDVLASLPYLKQYAEIDLLGIDTDAAEIQNLKKNDINSLLLGEEAVNGNGTSADSEQAVLVLRDASSEISKHLENRRLLIVVAALGGGTGAAVEEILSLADDMGVSAVLLAVMPFSFESAERKAAAQQLLSQMDVHCQALVVIPNEKLLAHYQQNTAADAFSNASAYLAMAATGIATPFSCKNLFNVTPGILASLASVDGNPRCHFIQCACETSDKISEIADRIQQDPIYKELQSHTVIDRGIALLRVNANCREEEMEYVLNTVSNIFPDANMEVAACMDEAIPSYFSMTLLLHTIQQSGEEAELEEPEDEEETYPDDPAVPVAPVPQYPVVKSRKGGRKGSKQDNGQLTFAFVENDVGIFAGDPENMWNGVNVDIPTFRRKKEMIDKGT
ncbi:MAG: hypothetical protein IKP00_06420 [Victivallales bacterium]|nr:hypothetical protein [Victivallales bacterium]